MTLNDEYTITARRVEGAVAKVTQAWAENAQKATDQFRFAALPSLPSLPTDPTSFVEQWFDFSERLTRVNRQYALNLTSAANTFGGAVRQHLEGLGDAVRDQVQAVSHTTQDQLEKVADAEQKQIEQAEQAERDRIEQAKQAEREQARESRNAERQKARQERQAAHERYQGMNKTELTDELAGREMPKTGTVDELIERLVDADTR